MTRTRGSMAKPEAKGVMWFLASISLALLVAAHAGSASDAPSFQHSQCITTDLALRCPLLPFGLPERYMSPQHHGSFRVWAQCPPRAPSAVQNMFMSDISHSGRGVDVFPPPLLIESNVVHVGVPEPGTQLFNVTLVEDGAVIDWLVVCIEVTPGPWEGSLAAASDRLAAPSAGVLVQEEVGAYARRRTSSPNTVHEPWSYVPVSNGYPLASVIPTSILWVRDSAGSCVALANHVVVSCVYNCVWPADWGYPGV